MKKVSNQGEIPLIGDLLSNLALAILDLQNVGHFGANADRVILLYDF